MPELVGSAALADTSEVALFYTNAVASSLLTILDLTTLATRVVDVTARFRRPSPHPDGQHAVTVMTPPSGSQAAGGVRPRASRARTASSHPGNGHRPALRCSVQPKHPRDDLGLEDTRRQDDARPPSGPPSRHHHPGRRTTRKWPDSRRRPWFRRRSHPQGQVTFIDLESGDAKTVTGFELSSQVVDP